MLALRIETKLLPGVTPRREEANGKVTITYDIGTLEAMETRDPDLPPDEVTFPEIDYSTGASWQTVAGEYSKIVDGRAESDAVRSIIDGLIAGKNSQAEKEAAILDFVDREVRYTGIGIMAKLAIVPHVPSETLAPKVWRLQGQSDTAESAGRANKKKWRCYARRGFRRMWRC